MTPEHTHRAAASVEVVGEHPVCVGPGELADLPTEHRSVEIVCSSGSRYTATWEGVPVADLLAVADVPPGTTHLVFAARDGHSACVAVEDAIDGLLAVSRDGRPLAESHPYDTRFVAPDVDGARAVKGVERVEAVELAPGERPEDVEDITTDSPEMGGSDADG